LFGSETFQKPRQVASSTNKKVLVARFDKGPVEGFAQIPEGLSAEGLDVLSQSGSLTHVHLADVRAVCFIREFDQGETWQKQRVFLSRPKASGLWVRVRFRDGEQVEGVMQNNLAAEPEGFSIVPPDPTSQNQRLFIPRGAVTTVEVLGVIGSPLKRRTTAKPDVDEGKQLEMFG
jgi:hypothetical protein